MVRVLRGSGVLVLGSDVAVELVRVRCGGCDLVLEGLHEECYTFDLVMIGWRLRYGVWTCRSCLDKPIDYRNQSNQSGF